MIVQDIKAEISIYEVRCKTCDASLGYDAEADSDGELIIQVEPCPDCLKESKPTQEGEV